MTKVNRKFRWKHFWFIFLAMMIGTFGSGFYETCQAGTVSSHGSFQQTGKIKGKVVDETGNPLPGVSIGVKGTTLGCATDYNGEFELPYKKEMMIIVSFISMETQILKIENDTEFLKIVLKEQEQKIEEVIVTGYGTQKKESFTGSAEVLSVKKLENSQKANPIQALEGAMAGVQIFNSSGQPGSAPSIRIRGISSLNAYQEPLIVVDGLIYEGNLANISQVDIESMTTLKDAAATSLYGARGGNGVIVITTKSGRKESTNIQISSSIGFSERGIPEYDRLNQKQYYETAWTALKAYAEANDYTNAGKWASDNLISELGTNCYDIPGNILVDPTSGKLNPSASLLWQDDWEDTMYRKGMKQEYNASLSGGNKNTSYYFSVGKLEHDGILDDSDFSRNNARINVKTQPYKWLLAGSNITVSESSSSYTKQEQGSVNAVLTHLRFHAPIYTLYRRNEKGEIIYGNDGKPELDYGTGENGDRIAKYNSGSNILSRKLDPQVTERNSIMGTFFTEIEPFKDLNFKIVYSKSYDNVNGLNHTNMLYGNGIANGGSTARSFSTGTTESFKQFITYQKEIKGHRLSLTGVHENYELEMQGMQGSKQGFPLPYIYEFTAATKINNLSSSKESYATEAYLLKFDYEYKFKYYLNSSIRREGSSKFHKNNRWGNFAALGLAWRVTGENFMEDITWINNMRLKVSYGTNGNDNLPGYYPYQALYATGYNNGAFSGITCASFANEDLTWEKQNKFNTGVDVSILKSLFDFQVEYFSNKTTDLLFYRPIPVSTGKSSVAMNIGSMVNKGFEFTVNAHPIRKEFKWDISFNITSYKNEVTELAEDQIRHSNKMYEVGKSAYEFYLAKSAGIDSKTGNYLWWRKFERDAEGNKIPVYLKDQEGQFVYDKKGNRVKAPNSKTVSNGFQLLKEEETTDNQLLADEYYRGTSLPDFYGGLSNNFSYKGFNLGIDLTYSIGGKMIDHTYGKLMHRGSLGMNWHKDILNAWTPENKNTDVPSVIFHGSQIGMQNEDRYLIDASYLNISNINLSYNLPNRFIEKFNLKGVKLKVSGENLYQFNKRKGLNAMMNMTGGSGSDSYSLLRTYTFGVTVNL